EILPGRAAPPRVRARASVGEHPAREDEPLLPFGPELGERLEPLLLEPPGREVELRLDVGLLRPWAEVGGVALRAQQEPDRLREDRLAGSGLAGDRVQSGGGLELRRSDEHEVLDPELTKQRS